MKTVFALASILSLASITAGCGDSMQSPDIKLNPHPKMRYELTLSLPDAPGPFDTATGSVLYKVTNGPCTPAQPISGAVLTPEKQIPIELTRISDHEYRSVIYLDTFLDEDYYGQGTCHWGVNTVNLYLKIGKVTFAAFLTQDEIVAQKPATTYLWKPPYLDHTKDDHVGNGVPLIDAVRKYPQEYFSATVTAKEQFE